MSGTKLKLVGMGLFALVVFATGFWLSLTGKPYSAIILAVHKLITVAALAFLVATIIQVGKSAKLDAAEFIPTVVTGLLLIATFASGGFLSTGREMPAFVFWIHRILPFLSVIATAETLYILLKRR